MTQADPVDGAALFRLRFGVHSGQQYRDVGECVRLWRCAEELGYDWASLFDHARPPVGGPAGPCMDGPTLLAALAGATERIRCGMLLSPVTLRHPAMAAMAACTLDQISRGRLEWGIGAGGSDLGYEQYGIALPPVPERMDRLEEACEAITGLWSGRQVTLEGRYYRFHAARLEPGPVQDPIPLVLGGGGERRFLPIAARYADVWNTILVPAGDYQRKAGILDEHCERLGRDPRRIRRSLTFRAVLAETPRAARARAAAIAARLGPGHPDHREYLTIGTPGQCVDDLEVFYGLGVTDFLLGCRPPLDWETIELFARQVMPVLGQAERGVVR